MTRRGPGPTIRRQAGRLPAASAPGGSAGPPPAASFHVPVPKRLPPPPRPRLRRRPCRHPQAASGPYWIRTPPGRRRPGPPTRKLILSRADDRSRSRRRRPPRRRPPDGHESAPVPAAEGPGIRRSPSPDSSLNPAPVTVLHGSGPAPSRRTRSLPVRFRQLASECGRRRRARND